MSIIIRDKDTEYLVHQDTGEVLYERTAQDALTDRRYDATEVDPIVLGTWLIGLSRSAARLLLHIAEKVRGGHAIPGDIRHHAQDAGLSPRDTQRAVRELATEGVYRNGHLNPTIAYSAPYGLENNDRGEHVRHWYSQKTTKVVA